MSTKRTWQLHLDLQCPYSKKVHALLPALRQEFGGEFDFEIVLMALPWHFSAFHALVVCHAGVAMGMDRDAYIERVFAVLDTIANARTAKLTREETFKIFVDIAVATTGGNINSAELLRQCMTREPVDFYMTAWRECKIGITAGVMGSPKHVIDGSLVVGTDSEWTVAEYAAKIATLPAPGGVQQQAQRAAAVAALAVIGVAWIWAVTR